jgi:peptide/nickel transport system substrate-binding protein
MRRRHLLAAGAAMAASGGIGRLASPALAASDKTRVLKFVPQGNLQNPDPIWTTTVIAHNHAVMIWDTLFSLDGKIQPKPQMLSGYELSDDKLTWTFTLRDKLRFHDNEPVRAIDCVTSINRWSKRDGFGQRMNTQLAEMRALDDRRFEIRFNKPFALLPYALAYGSAFIMPERMSRTDPYQQITEYVGSGPFKFVRDEWVSGSQAVYARFDGYVPRDEPHGSSCPTPRPRRPPCRRAKWTGSSSRSPISFLYCAARRASSSRRSIRSARSASFVSTTSSRRSTT